MRGMCDVPCGLCGAWRESIDSHCRLRGVSISTCSHRRAVKFLYQQKYVTDTGVQRALRRQVEAGQRPTTGKGSAR